MHILKTCTTALSVICLVSVHGSVSHSADSTYGFYRKIQGYRMIQEKISLFTPSVLACCRACSLTDTCYTVNYNERKTKCELILGANLLLEAYSLKDRHRWNLYTNDEGTS